MHLPRSDPNVLRSLLLPNETRPKMRRHKFIRFMWKNLLILILLKAQNRRRSNRTRTSPTKRAKRYRIRIRLRTGLIRNLTMIGRWSSRLSLRGNNRWGGDGFGSRTGQEEHAAMGFGRNGRISCRSEGRRRRWRRWWWVFGGIASRFGIGGEILVVDVIEIDGGIFVGFCHPPPPRSDSLKTFGISGFDQKQRNLRTLRRSWGRKKKKIKKKKKKGIYNWMENGLLGSGGIVKGRTEIQANLQFLIWILDFGYYSSLIFTFYNNKNYF